MNGSIPIDQDQQLIEEINFYRNRLEMLNNAQNAEPFQLRAGDMFSQITNDIENYSRAITEAFVRCDQFCQNLLNPLKQDVFNWRVRQKHDQYSIPRATVDQELSEISLRFQRIWKLHDVSFMNFLKVQTYISKTCGSNNENWLYKKLLETREQILNDSFLVVKQPPMIVKGQLVLDVGLLALNPGISRPPWMRCRIVSEQTAAAIKKNGVIINDNIPTIGKISNSNIKETRLTQLGDYMGFKYRNVNIKVDNRRAVPDAEEEAILTKYYLLFDTQISVPDYCTVEPTKRCTVELYTFSLPFMVSVHVKQEPIQLPYMLWDTAFSAESIVSIDQIPMQGPVNVPIFLFKQVLKKFFLRSTNKPNVANRGLSDADLSYLIYRLFNGCAPANDNEYVSWGKFYEERLMKLQSNTAGELNFSFWTYFHSIITMILKTKLKIKPLWDEKIICGFISKYDAKQILLQQINPTFLIRFSDNHLAGVSFVVCYGNGCVTHLYPFASKGLIEKLSLPNIIMYTKELRNVNHIYPMKHKSRIALLADPIVNHGYDHYSPWSLDIPGALQ